ncbi:MAG: hypothetical protein HYY40_10285 [Bacteroidetes bacterium]|nr:hypothetical protein [Bacteroidota bacterium]
MNIRNYFIAVPLLLVSRGNFFAQNVFTYEDIIKQSVIDTNFTTILQKKISSLTFSADTEILQYLFQNPALPNQLDSQITTIAELEYQLKKFDITTSDFFNSYSPITVLNDTLIDTITRISFQFNSKTYYAYCFFVPGMVSADSVATLIIPGSGTNQSTEIYYKTGYHGPIVDNVSKYGDTYIFVKPNQDFLGIHRENKLLMDEAIVPFLINTGFSYTAYYLTQCVAFAKYLKNKYRKIAIVGLSQGGTASLYVSLQAEPAAAVIASGFSVLFEKFALMGMNQPIGHELLILFRIRIQNMLSVMERWMFLFTKQKLKIYIPVTTFLPYRM